jgi:RNA polymerase sigma-70 factor (ECF subfamily)
MNRPNHESDLKLAQIICTELRSGNKEAIVRLHEKYQRSFTFFVRKRLFAADPCHVETTLNNFWLELLNAQAICSFLGKTSLKSFLLTILHRRVIDSNRKIISKRNKNASVESLGETNHTDLNTPHTPEEVLLQREKLKMIHEALLKLSRLYPRDAGLMKMYLQGLNYREMAEQELASETVDQDEIKKKANAIKKQFTRQGTGTIDRFKNVIADCSRKYDLSFAELIN